MPSCVLRYCKSRYGKTTEPERTYSLFTFPPSHRSEREKWIKFVRSERRDENWLPSASSKLCSKHFKDTDIITGKTGRKQLSKNAIPCDEQDQVTDESVTTVSTSDPNQNQFRTGRRGQRRQDKTIKQLCQQHRYLKAKVKKFEILLKHLTKKVRIEKAFLTFLMGMEK